MLFHLYGFFIGLGILTGLWIAGRINSKFQITNYPLPITNLLPRGLIPGIIGARLYHVLDYWSYYSQYPGEIFYLWQGGLGIYGGIAGGVLGIWLFYKVKNPRSKVKSLSKKLDKVNFLSLLDLIAFGLPVGQAVGRLGNFFNQELYGLPTSLPWGIHVGPENRLPGYENFAYFQPLFAYEAAWNIVIFIILIKILNSKFKIQKLINYQTGSFFLLYLGLYGFGRFWLEFLRIEPWQIGGINVAQGISGGLMLISLVWLTKKQLRVKL